MPPSRPYTPLGNGVSASWMHYLIVFLLLVIGGMGIAILTLVGINKTETDQTQHQNRVIIRAIDALVAEEETETFRCPPANPTAAPWLYQDPDTCMETMRIGVYFNVSEANLYLVNKTALQAFFDVIEPWNDKNFALYWRTTVRFWIFDGDHPPPGNDWTPYVPLYINDVNLIQIDSCAFHYIQVEGYGVGVENFIGSWAPIPKIGTPWISLPIGTPVDHGPYDGVWLCQISRNLRYGWNTNYFQNFALSIMHEAWETIANPQTIRIAYVNNLQNLNYSFSFMTHEIVDPFEFFVPYQLDDTEFVLSSFAVPSYFSGCLVPSAFCQAQSPPYDFQGLTNVPVTPRGGYQQFYAYDQNQGTMRYCQTRQLDAINNGVPYDVCQTVAYPGVLPDATESRLRLQKPDL